MYLLCVHALGSVKRLDQCRGLTDEQRIESSSGEHADDGQPDVRDTLRWVATVADTQHVRQCFEQRPSVLL